MMFDPFDELELMEDYWCSPGLEESSFIVDSPPRPSPTSSSSSSSISPSKPTEKHDKPPKTYNSAKELYFNDPIFELEDCTPYFNFSAPLQAPSPLIKTEPGFAETVSGGLGAAGVTSSGLGSCFSSAPLKSSPQTHSVDYFTPLSDYTPLTKKRKLSPGGLETAFSGLPVANSVSSDFPQGLGQGGLSNYQKLEVKRQRRVVKSSVSRNRKKAQIDELEKKVIELTQENGNLRENLESMAIDNAKLREEVYLLQSAVHKSGMNAVMTRGTSFLSSLGKQKQVHASTGLVLLVVLFSFGLFFNNLNMAQQKPIIVSNRIETALPQVKYNRKETKQWTTSAATEQNSFGPAQQIDAHIERRKQEIQPEVIPKQPQQLPTQSTSPNSHLVQQQLPQKPNISKIPNISTWKQNTTYLLVDSLSQLLPPKQALIQADEDELPAFSFLVPPDKATNLTGLGGLDEGAFLEISCHVIAFNRIPALMAKT